MLYELKRNNLQSISWSENERSRIACRWCHHSYDKQGEERRKYILLHRSSLPLKHMEEPGNTGCFQGIEWYGSVGGWKTEDSFSVDAIFYALISQQINKVISMEGNLVMAPNLIYV